MILNENGKVIRVYSGKNQGSEDDRLLIQAELAEKNDTQVIEQRQHAGFSSRPPLENERLFVTRINSSYLVSLAEEDGILNDDLSAGETRVYSSDSGSIAAFINFLNSGNLQLNGNGDFAVRFSNLETMVTSLNNKYDAHTHPDPVSGSSGVPSNAPLGLDISGAKIDEIEVPS